MESSSLALLGSLSPSEEPARALRKLAVPNQPKDSHDEQRLLRRRYKPPQHSQRRCLTNSPRCRGNWLQPLGKSPSRLRPLAF